MIELRSIQKLRRAAKESGLTYQQIGVRMSYPPKSARQSVWQLLHSTNPSLARLRRFAAAVGVEARELL